MTSQEIVDFYVAIPQSQKCFFLFTLASELDKVCATAHHNVRAETDYAAMQFGGLRELLYQISEEAKHYFEAETGQYPDDVFTRILLHTAESAKLSSQFALAFRTAAQQNLRTLDANHD